MEAWIPITIFAAFCQNLRSALQKHLKDVLGTTGATFVRFAYGVPFALLYVALLAVAGGIPFPQTNVSFWLAVSFGGLAQILATFLLVHLFSYRNFAVGTAYSKTEPIQAALFGFVLLGESISWSTGLAILIGIVGVVTISLSRSSFAGRDWRSALIGRPALIGLASAALFGASAATYRVASLSLTGTQLVMQAAFALACATVLQTVAMAIWMALRQPDQLRASVLAWRQAIWVGASGVAGSAGWFTAMTLQNVAYVRALAQIELVFTFLASWLVFRETVLKSEIAGCVMIVAAVAAIILFR